MRSASNARPAGMRLPTTAQPWQYVAGDAWQANPVTGCSAVGASYGGSFAYSAASHTAGGQSSRNGHGMCALQVATLRIMSMVSAVSVEATPNDAASRAVPSQCATALIRPCAFGP